MSAQRDTTPAHIWDVLGRLLNCNRTQLAKRLGISRRTLFDWVALTEQGQSPGTNAERRAADLLQATLRAAGNSDVHAQWRLNWDAIHTIGGRK